MEANKEYNSKKKDNASRVGKKGATGKLIQKNKKNDEP